MTAIIDRVRLAEAYLEGGDPLQALDMLEPLHEELDTARAAASPAS